MAKRWHFRPHDPDGIAALQRATGISAVVAELLVSRGITDAAAARMFLRPCLSSLRDPDLLPGCRLAAKRLHQALVAGRRIAIYGDYDVDGISGTAILWLCLKLLGGQVGYYIPHRIEEGYGLNAEALRDLAAEKYEVLVTVDCGIGTPAEAHLAHQLGMELIITDHHEPGRCLPEAEVIVHPRLPANGANDEIREQAPGGTEAAYPFGELSGSAVALKLAWALCRRATGERRVSPTLRDFLVRAVGLAALGTVADVVPLVDENRVLVHFGLNSLVNMPTPGVNALIETAGITAKRDSQGRPRLTTEDVAFQLAPRINAVGRLGQPQLGVELLITDRPERAAELARYVDNLNADRQTLERSIQLAAAKQAKEHFHPTEDAALVLAEHGWHPGVIGIVAGRLAEKFHRPVVLIAWDAADVRPGIGSARGVPGFNLHTALGECGEFLLAHGGHAAAAGLKIAKPHFAAFRAAFQQAAAKQLDPAMREAELFIDVETPLSALTLETVRQVEQLSPFGHGNHRPLMCSTGVRLASPPRQMGTEGQHLSLLLSQHDVTLRAVAFGGGPWAKELASVAGPVDVAFRPVINTFCSRQSVELHLVDWRPSAV